MEKIEQAKKLKAAETKRIEKIKKMNKIARLRRRAAAPPGEAVILDTFYNKCFWGRKISKKLY